MKLTIEEKEQLSELWYNRDTNGYCVLKDKVLPSLIKRLESDVLNSPLSRGAGEVFEKRVELEGALKLVKYLEAEEKRVLGSR